MRRRRQGGGKGDGEKMGQEEGDFIDGYNGMPGYLLGKGGYVFGSVG